MIRFSGPLASVAAAAFWAAAVATGTAQRSPAARIDFGRQIQPVLEKHCLECHNQDRRRGGLSLATYSDALEGGRTGAVIKPGGGARSLLIHRVTGAVEPQMPKDEVPLTAAEIALIQQWIDQGARETPTSAAAPQPWEATLALSRPVAPRLVWPRWSAPLDRHVAAYLRARRVPEPVRDHRCAVRAARVSRRLGPAADAGGTAGVPGGSPSRQARRARAIGCSPTTRNTPSTGSRSGTICCATRTASATSPRPRARKSITDWLLPALTSNLPYDQFVTTLLNPGRARRSRGVPDRRELARGDERGGDAVDAGGAEHGAGLPRRQPQVQRLPRQLRQPVEAEGRLRAGRLLFAGADAAAVPVRRRAEQVRRAGVPLSGAGPGASDRVRWPIVARPSRRSSPTRATAGCRARWSIASGSGCFGRGIVANPTRWTAGPGARSCSTGSRATSSRAATTSSA